jgi:hypothetical protein
VGLEIEVLIMSNRICRIAGRRSVALAIAAAFMLAPIAAVGGCTQADRRNLEYAGEAVAEVTIGIIIMGVYIVIMAAAGASGNGDSFEAPSQLQKHFRKEQTTPFY